MHVCRLRNIAMHDYQESVTTGQIDTQDSQCDPYVPLCFAGVTKIILDNRSFIDYLAVSSAMNNINVKKRSLVLKSHHYR